MASDIRTRILLEATELFAQLGYRGTSMRAVAEAVGCTKPALYYHFGSKEDLFSAAVTEQLAHHERVLREILQLEGPLRERLRTALDAFFAHLQAQPSGMKLLMTAQHTPAEQGAPKVDLMPLHDQNLRLMMAMLEEGIRSGEIRSGVELRTLCTSFIGLVNIWGVHCLFERPVPNNVTEHILDIFFHGVAPS